MSKRKFLGVLFVVLVSALLSAGLIFDSTECVVYGSSGTDVSGIIASDATWTQVNSPYSLTGPVGVSEGATLTIEAGVTVNLNSYYIQVNGTLYARGSSTDPIYINGGINGVDSSGYTLYPTFYSGGLISQNSISGYTTGIKMHSDTSTIVQGNIITANTNGIQLIVHQGPVSPIIKNNTITDNFNGISLIRQFTAATSPTILNNNIYANSNYNINSEVPDNIEATNNWWGTTDASAINQSIRDFKNDFNLGVVTFVPFLTEPNPEAPEPEPTPTLTTHISISVDASSTVVGSAVNVNGRLAAVNGSVLQGKSITLSYSITGNDWVPIGSGTTNAAGEYTIQWVNTASGTFTLKVEWNGNDDYLGANATTTLSFLPHQNQKIFFVESNSTVSALTFNSTNAELSLTVSGSSGTTGYVKATIPKELLSAEGDWVVLVDEQPVIPTVNENSNNTYLYFTYGHSTKTIEIIGTDAIPEFLSWTILPLFLTATVLIIFCKRKILKTITK